MFELDQHFLPPFGPLSSQKVKKKKNPLPKLGKSIVLTNQCYVSCLRNEAEKFFVKVILNIVKRGPLNVVLLQIHS